MANKLTPEQKALNKEATKLRNAAFRRRQDAYRSEMGAAKEAIELSEIGKAADAANAAFDAAIELRGVAASAVKENIRALEKELERVMAEHGVSISQAKDARNATYKLKSSAILEAERGIEARYPDVAGCYGGAGGWKSIDEFLPLVGKK